MPKVRLRSGGAIHYEVVDMTDPWRRPETVLLHHGLGKSSRFWLPWYRLLARDYRVIAMDTLGNGRSSRPRGHRWSIAGYAGNVLEVLNALRLKQVHFVGEGLGGCVGLQLGARHPARLRTLTLCATPYSRAEATGDLGARSREIAAGGLRKYVEVQMRDRTDWARFPPEMLAWYRRQRLAVSPRILAEQMSAQAHIDLAWTLPLIKAPTLLIIPGANPTSGADSQMARMAQAIPKTRAVRFPRERQWVTFTAAEECVAAFRSFVAEVAPA